RDANDRSLAVAARVRGAGIFLPGDLETNGLRDLLRRGRVPRCDLLQAPHHGSENDALGALIAAARPRLAWIPARAGFASEATLRVFTFYDVPIASTSVDGSLRLLP
ncbi:MAG TPA: hypothetical protein VEI02_00685, partial [Planctomycetota bacterium]|nr:hypothetical protein [Planctomycetota bacterium]